MKRFLKIFLFGNLRIFLFHLLRFLRVFVSFVVTVLVMVVVVVVLVVFVLVMSFIFIPFFLFVAMFRTEANIQFLFGFLCGIRRFSCSFAQWLVTIVIIVQQLCCAIVW